MAIKTILQEEIEDQINDLSGLELGSDVYKASVDGITKLLDRAIEIEKLETSNKEKIESRESDENLRKNEMEENKKDQLVKNAIAIAGIVIPTVITVWGTIKTLKFEEEGTITTAMGRGFIQKLLPRK